MRIFLLCSLFCVCFGYKILVFSPVISRSHMISNGRIADELAKAGHDVVMFEPDFMRIFDKVNAAKVARRWPVHGFSLALRDIMHTFSGDAFQEDNVFKMNMGLIAYERAYNQHCKEIIDRDDLMQQLRDEKFDAFFGEQINWCGNAIAHQLGIKSHFWISSCPVSEAMAWTIGMPWPYSYLPVSIALDMSSKPSYMDRVYNIIYATVYLLATKLTTNELTDIFRHKYGPSFPAIEDIARDSDMIFVSTDEFIEFPRPLLPNVVHIGGLGLTDETGKIGEIFEKEMSLGQKGVIYFSLGTNVNTTSLPPFAMKTVIETANRLPEYHFVIKVDETDKYSRTIAAGVKNVGIHDWVPQAALLKHPRLLCFITHAGYNGIIEAARAGVPLIMMPFMFDQTKNSNAVSLNGWGIPLRRQILRDAPEKLEEALRKMINDPSYKKAALRVQYLVRNKPFNATERLIRHTEFVLANGGMKELLVEGRHLNTFQYYNMDIFLPFIGILVAFMVVFVKITSFVMRRLFGAKAVKTKTQ